MGSSLALFYRLHTSLPRKRPSCKSSRPRDPVDGCFPFSCQSVSIIPILARETPCGDAILRSSLHCLPACLPLQDCPRDFSFLTWTRRRRNFQGRICVAFGAALREIWYLDHLLSFPGERLSGTFVLPPALCMSCIQYPQDGIAARRGGLQALLIWRQHCLDC